MSRLPILSRKRFFAAPLCLALIAGCADDPGEQSNPSLTETDPLIGSVLADPIMSDPDLAYRNEANAAVTVRYDNPLPPLRATEELTELARNAAQNVLLLDGEIEPLPMASGDSGIGRFAQNAFADDMLRAAGGPGACAGKLSEDLGWAARMPGPSAVMPHGMVQQAAGSDDPGCMVRIVRYLTPAAIDDALQYHFNRAQRARLRPAVFEKPERTIVGNGRTEQVIVAARPGPGGLSAVDIVYWSKT